MVIKHLLVSGFDHWRCFKWCHLKLLFYLPLISVLSFHYFCHPNFQPINLPDREQHDGAERRRWFIKRMASFFSSQPVLPHPRVTAVLHMTLKPRYICLSHSSRAGQHFSSVTYESIIVSKVSDSYRWHVM